MELPIVSVEKIEEDVIINSYKEGVRLTEKDAQDIDNIHLTYSQGKDMFIIADFSKGNSSFDSSAEEFFINKGRMIPFTNGIAIISNPKRSSFLTKIFTRRKPIYPVKECKNIEEALNWFNKLREDLSPMN